MSITADKLSHLGANLQGSEIRRLFATSMRPGVISFAGGLPDPESFPSVKIAQVIQKLLHSKGDIYLQYGSSRGSEEGIAAAVHQMRHRNITVPPEQIFMASGSQQVVSIVSQIFLNPGDVVLLENPSFVGAIGVFRNSQAQLHGIPMDEFGVIPEEMVKVIKRLKGHWIKFFYTIPNFQNPSGLTLALKRRQDILDIAREYDFLILEDDPYGELWFQGGLDGVRPIKALDTEGRVIYTSSFSKTISPGIRVAWAVTTPEIIDRCDMARQMLDVCSNPLMQAVAHELAMSGFLDEHIPRLRTIYMARAQAMLTALAQHMPAKVSWSRPNGGFYIWVTLPEELDSLDLLGKALQHNVAFVIGNSFSPDFTAKNKFRISFCHEPEDIIHEGIRRLADSIKEMIKDK
jgi:2-aminoadipate transaminase